MTAVTALMTMNAFQSCRQMHRAVWCLAACFARRPERMTVSCLLLPKVLGTPGAVLLMH